MLRLLFLLEFLIPKCRIIFQFPFQTPFSCFPFSKFTSKCLLLLLLLLLNFISNPRIHSSIASSMALSTLSLRPFVQKTIIVPCFPKFNPKPHQFITCSHASNDFLKLSSSFDDPVITSPSESRVVRIREPDLQITLAELLDKSGVAPLSVSGDLGIAIAGIKNDSRKVKAGDLFVCCFGYKTNGHLYVNDAVQRGAVGVVVSESMEKVDDLGCNVVVVVENPNKFLPVLAAAFYQNPSKGLLVIGITGTNGKTTTTCLVRSVLQAAEVKTGMLGSVGYYVNGFDQVEAPNTTPDAVAVQELMARMVRSGTRAAVMEVSSIGLAVGRCDEVDFDVAVFMNLTRDHHDFHGDEEEYRKSKGKLFDKLLEPRRHRKIVNFDDPNVSFFVDRGGPNVPVVSFGMENKNADVYPLKMELSVVKTRVWAKTPMGVVEITSGLVGRYNVYNILAALAVGIAIGLPLKDITRGIENVKGVPGRFEAINEGQDFAVVVDYAHSPDSFSRLLDAARELGAQRIITVFGCAGETDKGKRPMLTKIASEKSDVVILTCGNPKTENQLHIFDDMLAGLGWNLRDFLQYSQNDHYLTHANGHRLFLHDIRRVAIRAAIAMAKEDDMIFFLGRGHETYQLVGDTKRYIDDRAECREALQNLEMLQRAGMDKRFPMVTVTEPREFLDHDAADKETISVTTSHTDKEIKHCEVIREPSSSSYEEVEEALHALIARN